jgi:hypothetical protein
MIRIRRLPKPRFRRRPYEIEYRPLTGSDVGWHKITTAPIFDLEKVVGTGDAWAMINAADADWDGAHGEWVSVYAPDEERPEDEA